MKSNKESRTCINCSPTERMLMKKMPDNRLLQTLVDQERLTLYAGNCSPLEFDYWIENGNHYTMAACFSCPKCGRYFLAGYCLYGNPIFKEISRQTAKKWANSMEWGYVGTAFTTY